MERTPSGGLVTKGGGAFPGTRADADAILQGIQTAQATPVVRGTGEEAGQSSAVATLAQPGWGAQVGSYNNAPVGPVTARAAPAAPPPAAPPPGAQAQPAAPAPAPAPSGPDIAARDKDGNFIVPDEKLSVPQYQSRYRLAPTADELTARGLVIPGNEAEMRAAATGVQEQEANARAAQALANAAQQGLAPPGTSADKAVQASIDAQGKAQDARQKYAEMLQDTTKTNATNLAGFYKEQDAQLAAAHKDLLDRIAQRQNIQVTSDVKAGEEALTAVNNTRDAARDTINNLETAKQLSKIAGQPSFLTQWPEVRNFLMRNNFLTAQEGQQLTAQQALDSVVNRVILNMRQGSGISRMTNFDLQFLQNVAPNSFTPEQSRPAMFAAIQGAAQRQLDYSNLVNEYHAGGMPVWQAKEQADAKLGPLVKTVPKIDRDGKPMTVDAQNAWVLSNVNPGTFYVKPNGKLSIRGEQ
jgi:hypothetical protein